MSWRKRLTKLVRENPRMLEEILRELVAKYYREKILKGPPDRFNEAREKAKEIWAAVWPVTSLTSIKLAKTHFPSIDLYSISIDKPHVSIGWLAIATG